MLLSSGFGKLIKLRLGVEAGVVSGLLGRDVSLPQAALRRLRSSHGS